MSKFTVEYSRLIRVKAYENVRIGLIQEFDLRDASEMEAFDWVRMKVLEMVKDEVARLGSLKG